jgi:hypothetical protein
MKDNRDEVLMNIRLLLTRWYRDFNEPVPYKTELDRDVREMASKDFPLGVIEAGIRRYRDTYMYGRTRNWAHLMQSCMEVNKKNKKIMPAGLAADVFFAEMSTGYIPAAHTDYRHFLRHVENSYGEDTAYYIAAAHRRCGDSIRYDDRGFAIRKFIKAYEEVIAETVVLPPIPTLSSGTKSIKELIDGEVTERITRLHVGTLDSPTDENGKS